MEKGQEKIPEIPLQQTNSWYKLQQELNENTFFLTEKDKQTKTEEKNTETTKTADINSKNTGSKKNNYQILAIEKSTPFGPYLYLPYGPYIATKDASKTAYKALRSLADEKSVIFMRIEPQDAEIASYWLEQPNCKESKNLNPKETWVLDITPEIDEIYKGMKQNTRNLCRNYQNKGITVKKFTFSEKSEKEIEILINLQKNVAKKNHFTPATENYLKTEYKQPFASLFIAYQSKTPIAASLFFDGENTRYYMQSASDPNFRKLPGTNAILIEAIKDAKKIGLKNFDFWGIAPENADKNHPWAGFTDFKKSFGGKEKIYAGTYDIVLKPFKYRIYNLTRKINLLIRKIKKIQN